MPTPFSPANDHEEGSAVEVGSESSRRVAHDAGQLCRHAPVHSARKFSTVLGTVCRAERRAAAAGSGAESSKVVTAALRQPPHLAEEADHDAAGILAIDVDVKEHLHAAAGSKACGVVCTAARPARASTSKLPAAHAPCW